MKPFPDAFNVLTRIDITDVISQFTALHDVDDAPDFKVLSCPFCQTSKRLFNISISKGVYKCLTCGEGGKTVDFVMKLTGRNYQEAIYWLDKRFPEPSFNLLGCLENIEHRLQQVSNQIEIDKLLDEYNRIVNLIKSNS